MTNPLYQLTSTDWSHPPIGPTVGNLVVRCSVGYRYRCCCHCLPSGLPAGVFFTKENHNPKGSSDYLCAIMQVFDALTLYFGHVFCR
jgi:hypothetical protein